MNSIAQIDTTLYRGPLNLTQISKMVYQLALSLPYRTHQFILYMKNYFTNIRLLDALRSIGIGGCGTTYTSSAEYHRELKFRKRTRFLHNMISGVICRSVVCVLWQDNNLVRFLSTVNNITADSQHDALNWQLKDRNRHNKTDYHRQHVETAWGELGEKIMLIPRIALD